MGSSRSMRCIRVGSRSDFIFISRGFSSCARGKWLCSAANATGGRLDGHAARQNGTLFSWSVLESARVASAIEPHQLTKFPSSKRLMSSVIHVEPVGGHWRSAREGLIYWLFISAVISGDLVDDCRKKTKAKNGQIRLANSALVSEQLNYAIFLISVDSSDLKRSMWRTASIRCTTSHKVGKRLGGYLDYYFLFSGCFPLLFVTILSESKLVFWVNLPPPVCPVIRTKTNTIMSYV